MDIDQGGRCDGGGERLHGNDLLLLLLLLLLVMLLQLRFA